MFAVFKVHFTALLQGHWIPTQRKIEFVDLFKLGSHSVQILKNGFLICFFGLLQKYLSRDLNFIRLVPVHEPSSDKSTVYFFLLVSNAPVKIINKIETDKN